MPVPLDKCNDIKGNQTGPGFKRRTFFPSHQGRYCVVGQGSHQNRFFPLEEYGFVSGGQGKHGFGLRYSESGGA
jgi:hypothetical protein